MKNKIKNAFLTMSLSSILCVSSCTDESGAKALLEAQGYKNVKITGYRHFMAGQDDTYSTGFEAISPNGTVVTGAVTKAWGKGSTIRFD